MEKIKTIEFTIPAANAEYKAAGNLDTGYSKVIGIALYVSETNALKDAIFADAFLIDSKEVFPSEYPVKAMYTGFDTPADERFYDITKLGDYGADGKNYSFKFRDRGTASYPYRVQVLFLQK